MDVAIGEEPSTPLPRGEGGPGRRSSPAERREKPADALRPKVLGDDNRSALPHTLRPPALQHLGPQVSQATLETVESRSPYRKYSYQGRRPPAISEALGKRLSPHATGRPPDEA